MRAKTVAWPLGAAAATVLLVGCGDATVTAPERVSEPVVYAGPVSAPTLAPETTPPASNADAVAKALALFGDWGLVEAEPPHGSPSAIMWGRRGDLTLLASVYPPSYPAGDGEVIDSYEIGGVVVQTVQQTGQQVLMRFTHGGLVVSVAVLVGDQLEPDLEETRALVDARLCPSECGDLPEGADG